jgi:hypothetical protein
MFFDRQITKHKAFEVTLQSAGAQPLEISLEYSDKRDHAGLAFVFSCLKLLYFEVRIYDIRHWDWDNDCWAGSQVEEAAAAPVRGPRIRDGF